MRIKEFCKSAFVFLFLLLIPSIGQSDLWDPMQFQGGSGSHHRSGYHFKGYKSTGAYQRNSSTKSYKSKTYKTSHSSFHFSPLHRANYSSGARDSHGRKKRSWKARYEFMKQSGYPHGRKGYVVDHIIPLKKGGCDCPSNMQWQTIEAAKAKDRWETP